MNTKETLTAILSSKNLDSPNGYPLYSYKINESEFHRLSGVLSQSSTTSYGWAEGFLLFAAEWWRRKYDGGPWKWDPVFQYLNKQTPSANERSNVIEKGSKFWKRPKAIMASGRSDFFGTIVREGGIPNSLLLNPNATATIRWVIQDTFKKVWNNRLSTVSRSDYVLDLLEGRNVAKVYKSLEFAEMLLEFTEELVRLKKTNQFGSDPAAQLDAKNPQWREGFPLAVDSKEATEFVNLILSDIAKQPEKGFEAVKAKIYLQREPEDSQEFKVKAILNIDRGFYDLTSLGFIGSENENEFESFPPSFSLQLIDNEGNIKTLSTLFKSKKNDEVRIQFSTKVKREFDLANVFGPSFLRLSNDSNGSSIQSEKPAFESLMEDPFMVFRKRDEGFWELKSRGSVRLSDSHYRILIPINSEIASEKNEYLGNWKNHQVLECTGDLTCIVDQNLKFSVRSNSPSEDSTEFEIYGNSFPYFPERNNQVFLGLPTKFYRVEEEKKSPEPNQNIFINGLTIGNDPARSLGKQTLQIKNREGEILSQRKVTILSREFSLDYSQSAFGELFVSDPALQSVAILNPEVFGKLEKNIQNNFYFKWDKKEQAVPSSILILELAYSYGKAKIQIPFPYASFQFFGPDQKQIQRNIENPISLNSIYGTSLSGINFSNSEKLELTFTYQSGCNANGFGVQRSAKINKKHEFASISLVDFKPLLEKLFSLSDVIDARVRVEVHGTNSQLFFKRYETTDKLRYFRETKTLTGNSSRVLVQIFDLEKSIADQDFPTKEIEGIDNVINWLPSSSELGRVVIYPAINETIRFRPFLHEALSAEFETDSFLALNQISDTKKRKKAISDYLEKASLEFENSIWNDLEKLFENTNHISLVYFDYWSGLVQSELALVRFFIQCAGKAVFNRVTEEFLVLWQLIPIQKWVEIFEAKTNFFKRLCYENQIPFKIFENQILEDFDKISEILEMESLAKILKSEFLNEPSTGLKAEDIQRYFILPGINECRNRAFDSKWPIEFKDEIIQLFKKLPPQVKFLFPDHRDINIHHFQVLYLPAVLAFHSVFEESNFLTKPDNKTNLRMKLTIEFDPEWFSQTFNVIQSFCWSLKSISEVQNS